VAVKSALTPRAAILVTVFQDSAVMETNVWVSHINIMQYLYACPQQDSSFLVVIHVCLKQRLLEIPKTAIIGRITCRYSYSYNLQL